MACRSIVTISVRRSNLMHRLFFSGDHGWKWLRPYDFHVRITQVLPRLLAKEKP